MEKILTQFNAYFSGLEVDSVGFSTWSESVSKTHEFANLLVLGSRATDCIS